MAYSPVGVIVFVAATRIFVSVSTLGLAEVGVLDLPSCSGVLDFLTGCGGTVSAVLQSTLIGIVPGAPWWFNGLVATATNIALVWSILTWGRGT